jgi:tRNA nucleotidyltransferase (CCA-adding enzyme)
MDMVKTMSSLKRAKIILSELKKNGHEAYIVGGAVRDHLLRMPLTDIDITTSAKPYEVTKIFRKTKPTGLKYGTITVFIGEDTYEVTTFRTDSNYDDHRHPEVSFEATVIDDVMRRDFTINGLLMDVNDLIIDHIDGKKDLESKMIRAIGDPLIRFEEDALRMLRAFYFQAKLGFQIDQATRTAIMDKREDILKISSERVLMELIKMLKNPFSKRAIRSMVSTKMHEVLPGLKEGVEFIDTMDEIPFVDAFFTLCFALSKEVPLYWPFSNKHRHKYQMASTLANQMTRFDNITLYTYGLDICLMANKVNHMLNRSSNQRTKIERDFNQLPILSELDLALKPHDMMKITNKKPGAWLKEIQQAMVIAILEKKVKNDKNALIDYFNQHVT